MDSFWAGGLIFWCHIFLLFYAAPGVLTARILEWFAIPSSSGSHFVRTFHCDLSIWVALLIRVHSFHELCKPFHHNTIIHEGDRYVNASLNDRICLWGHLVLNQFVGRLLITLSTLVLVIGLFIYIYIYIFLISSWFSLGKMCFCKDLCFFLGYPFSWHIVSCSGLLSFVFLWCPLYLLFHFWFYWFEPSLSFLMRLAKGLSTYLNLFKDLSFIDLFYCFSSFSFISAMTLIIYFLLLKLFLVLLSVKARLFYLVFFMLPKVGLYCYKLLWTFLLCSIDFGSLCFICFQIFL